jgi:UDP:flavonoid glycosyltransferase YjiC (YdhE family)
MKILMVSRGSQGDIYPYLALAKKLQERGHDVSLNIPFQFEQFVKAAGLPYTTENDDIVNLVANEKLNFRDLLEWTGRVIHQQFQDLVPLVAESDVFVAANTEFAAPSIAEYTKKPLIRTAFAPLIPSKKIMPAVIPVVKPGFFTSPALMWSLINLGMNMMSRKNLNIGRKKLKMSPIKNQAEYAPSHANNLLMFSPIVGETDNDWKYNWSASGYCFYDDLPYRDDLYQNFLSFIKKDDRPVLFFSLGSINGAFHDKLAEWLLAICQKHNYKLLVGSGWWRVGTVLEKNDDLFLIDSVIPHKLILPLCTASIHHGGSGTTHSAARSGKPQMIMPHLIDQHYWGYRTKLLGLGPGGLNVKKLDREKLEHHVLDLMTNPRYKTNAAELGEKVSAENGLENAARYIENV